MSETRSFRSPRPAVGDYPRWVAEMIDKVVGGQPNTPPRRSKSEADLRSQLNLPWRRGLGELAKCGKRIRRIPASAEDIIDVGVIRSVQKVEHFEDPVESGSTSQRKTPAHPKIDGSVTRHCRAVAADA